MGPRVDATALLQIFHALWKVLELGCEISRTLKVLQSEFGVQVRGRGKYGNLLGSDADADIMCVNNCEVFQKFFFAISSQHVTEMNIYSSMDAAIILYILLVTAVCLYM